ncbi:MAG: flagellar protein FliS [Ancrocorticia sp.]|nr:flagellar protein FliS [Ancrocorticia sp.]
MNQAALLERFRAEAVRTASPKRVVILLYDRLMLDLERAQGALLHEDPVDARSKLVHAQDIVSALSDALDFGQWNGAEALREIYDYVYSLLVQASGESRSEPIAEARELLEPLRQAWHAVGESPRTRVEEPIGQELGVG